MPIAHWNARYETGHATIDAQHKGLYEAVNQVAAQVEAGAPLEAVRAGLDQLVARSIEHFAHEEQVMQALGYPKAVAHVTEHNQLLQKARDLQYRLGQGQDAATLVIPFLEGWLAHHLHEADGGYAALLREKGQG